MFPAPLNKQKHLPEKSETTCPAAAEAMVLRPNTRPRCSSINSPCKKSHTMVFHGEFVGEEISGGRPRFLCKKNRGVLWRVVGDGGSVSTTRSSNWIPNFFRGLFGIVYISG